MPRPIPDPKIIGVVGTRRRDTDADFRLCLAAFEKIYRYGDRVVSGGCEQGGDRFAEAIAKAKGLTITIHYPDWNGVHGKFAGFARNTLIAQDADILIAVVAEDRAGGTEDSIAKALRLKKKVILV
jgi:hypothetical protein